MVLDEAREIRDNKRHTDKKEEQREREREKETRIKNYRQPEKYIERERDGQTDRQSEERDWQRQTRYEQENRLPDMVRQTDSDID